MLKQALHNGWTVRTVGNLGEVPAGLRDAVILARVPGCVHTDLMRAGAIEDPYVGLNEHQLIWIGNTDWEYRTTFEAEAKLFDHERIDLACDGLDTVARIVLNDQLVGQTQNMHRGYRFDVRKLLRKGRNELVITFASPVKYANAMRDKLGHLPAITYGGPYNFIRKMACNFGWDWGPIVPTCGIWKGVRLEGWSGARIAAVRPIIREATFRTAVVDILIKLERTSIGGQWPIEACATIFTPTGDDLTEFLSLQWNQVDASIQVELDAPQLWWPAGYGSQSLCSLEVELINQGSASFVIEDAKRRIGLRTVELDTSPDDIGRKFVVKVNGKPIFCKGFNWIPDDCFLDRACTPARYRTRIQQALDANANMLRVWGGGIYETDEFYDICDELGVLVWQDFLFACAAYPEEEPFKSEVEAEARDNVARLSHHPSLVLWNGCNENIWMYHDIATDDGTGKTVKWKEQLAGRQWGQGYYLDLLPRIVKELDPSRPYWAASPWSGDPDIENGLHPNLATHGNKHIWEVWHGPGDYNNYRWFAPRFCSEFGYQAPANYATLVRALAPSPGQGEGGGEGRSSESEDGDPGKSPQSQFQSFDPHPNPLPAREREPEALQRGSQFLESHQKSPGGNDRNDRLLQKDFDLPENFDDWHYLLQLNQARALQTGVEWFRSRQPVCMGTLYWQLNDCWPVTSWSAIDGDGRLKPLWYATRRFYAPRLLTIQPEADGLVLYANNDSDEPWRGAIVVRRIDFLGNELARLDVWIDAAARSNLRAAVLPAEFAIPIDKTRELIAATIGDLRTFWFFAPDRELNYPTPLMRASLSGEERTYRLVISADALVRDAVLNIDRIDPEATIDDNLITLLPGDSNTFTIRTIRVPTVEVLTTRPVLQCANHFGKKS